MSITTIITLLLLCCLCATGTSLHRVLEEPLQEEAVKAFTVIVITAIRLEVTTTNSTLQLCTAEDLPNGNIQLTYKESLPETTQTTLDGRRDVVNKTCANFMMDPSFTLPDVTTRYELTTINPETSDVGRCVSNFAMTAMTTLLTCGTEVFTKVTWGGPTPIVYRECLATEFALLTEPVCYHQGDVWQGDFCFDITDNEGAKINICMNGLSSPVILPGSVSTNYFYYGTDAVHNGASKATLSLALGPDLTHSRAIVRLFDSAGILGVGRVYDCPFNKCTFNAYARKFANYDVCVEALDDNEATQTITTITFTDVNLNVFDGGSLKSSLMEFVFANWLEGATYSASYSLTEPTDGALGNPDSEIVNLDCTDVTLGHACFGFLDIGENLGPVYLALTEPSGTNTIVTPYVLNVPK